MTPMVKTGKPRGRKGAPPQREETKANLNKPEPGGKTTLNLNVEKEFKRELKHLSADSGMTMTDIIKAGVQLWKATQK